MKKLRNEKGITLIALIITIIVLLILAGITLSTLAGRRGIINQAQNAEKEHTKATALEDITLVTYQSLDNKGNTDTTKLEQGLNDIGATIKSKTENKWTVEQNGYEFEINIETGDVIAKGETGGTGEGIEKLVDMFRQAETDGCTNEDGTCDNPNHLHVGDYVNYQNPTTGTYTITEDKSGMDANQTYSIANNQLNWRVLGIDGETGGLKLIAGSPMKLNNIDGKNDPYLYMYGARAYLYGIQEIDKACEMYKNNHAIKARSVKIDDINELAGIEEDISTYNIMPIFISDIAPYGSSYSYTGYTPEGWINGDGKTTVTGEAKGYVYFSNEITSSVSSRAMNPSDGSSEIPVIPMPSTRARKMIFDNLDYTHGKDYWLASSGVFSYPSDGFAFFAPYAVFGDGGMAVAGVSNICNFSSDGFERGGDALYAVRPVVILKSDITKDQISKIADKTEETWNYNGGGWIVQFKSI